MEEGFRAKAAGLHKPMPAPREPVWWLQYACTAALLCKQCSAAAGPSRGAAAADTDRPRQAALQQFALLLSSLKFSAAMMQGKPNLRWLRLQHAAMTAEVAAQQAEQAVSAVHEAHEQQKQQAEVQQQQPFAPLLMQQLEEQRLQLHECLLPWLHLLAPAGGT